MEWCRNVLWYFRYHCEIVLGKCWILLAYFKYWQSTLNKKPFFFLFFPILLSHKSDHGNDTIEQIDEDIAVTRSQTNFICPITQVCVTATVIDREVVISCPSLVCLLQICSTC